MSEEENLDFNLNEEVKSAMSKVAASINFEQMQPLVNAANLYKSLFEDLTFPNVVKTLTAQQQVQINELQRVVKSIQKEVAKNFPNQAKAIDKIYDNGWSIGYSDGILRRVLSEPQFFIEMSKSEVDGYFLNTFSNEHTLKHELYNDAELLDEYGISLRIMGDVLETQGISECWRVLFPQLFAILDRMVVYQSQNSSLKNGEITRFTEVESFSKDIMKKDNSSDIFNYIYVRTLNKILRYWKGTNFSKSKVKYSRHSVQHGRYNPSNYTFAQFIRLVLTVSALSLFNE